MKNVKQLVLKVTGRKEMLTLPGSTSRNRKLQYRPKYLGSVDLNEIIGLRLLHLERQ